MMIASSKQEHYRGYCITAIPNPTVWGWRCSNEHSGKIISSRPNGAQTAADALALAREWVDEHIAISEDDASRNAAIKASGLPVMNADRGK